MYLYRSSCEPQTNLHTTVAVLRKYPLYFASKCTKITPIQLSCWITLYFAQHWNSSKIQPITSLYRWHQFIPEASLFNISFKDCFYISCKNVFSMSVIFLINRYPYAEKWRSRWNELVVVERKRQPKAGEKNRASLLLHSCTAKQCIKVSNVFLDYRFKKLPWTGNEKSGIGKDGEAGNILDTLCTAHNCSTHFTCSALARKGRQKQWWSKTRKKGKHVGEIGKCLPNLMLTNYLEMSLDRICPLYFVSQYKATWTCYTCIRIVKLNIQTNFPVWIFAEFLIWEEHIRVFCCDYKQFVMPAPLCHRTLPQMKLSV